MHLFTVMVAAAAAAAAATVGIANWAGNVEAVEWTGHEASGVFELRREETIVGTSTDRYESEARWWIRQGFKDEDYSKPRYVEASFDKSHQE